MNASRFALGLCLSPALFGCVRAAAPVDDPPSPSTACVSPAPCATPAPIDAEFSAACARFTAHFDDCGFHLGAALCETFARAPNASMRRTLECYARSPCVTTSDPCADATRDPSAALGARMSALCGGESFTDDLAALIAYEDERAWPDRIAALRACETADDCATMRGCVAAWVDAVER